MSQASARSFLKNSNIEIITDRNLEYVVGGGSSSQSPKSTGSLNFNNLAKLTPSPSPSQQRNSPVKIGRLRVSMYNATVNKDFDSSDKLNLMTLVSKKPLKPTRLENGMIINIREINGLYGRFQKAITATRNRGIQGNFNESIFTVQFKFTTTKNNKKKDGSFNIYKNGKMRFSGGIVDETNFDKEPEIIRKHIVENYTLGETFLYNKIEYNNLSGTVKTNAIIDLAKAARLINGSFEPELMDLMYYQKDGIKYVFSPTGVVQIQGVITMDKLVTGYENVKQMMHMFFNKNAIRRLQTNFTNENTMLKKKEKTKTTCPTKRIPVGGKCPPSHPAIRKNPQGFDCCYKKGKPTSPPKNKNIKLVLDANGALKIGARQCMRYTKGALANIAKNQGIVNISKRDTKESICAKLVNKLGIVQYAPFTHNGKEYIFNGSGNRFKVGGRVCKTYSLDTLKAFANKMNIPLTSKDKRVDICKKIENFRVRLPTPKSKTPSPKQKIPKKRGRPQKRKSKSKSKSNSNSNSNNTNLIRSIERRMGIKSMLDNNLKN